MEGRNTKPQGRGRSRARGTTPSGQPTAAPSAASAPLQGAWARRPGPAVESHEPYSPPPGAGRSVRPAAPQTGPHGDRSLGVSRPESTTSAAVMPVGGGGDAASTASLGRGAMRGRRIISSDTLITKPSTMTNSKIGTGGRRINLRANYFQVLSAPDWCLFQYHVDFSEEEDQLSVRKKLFHEHKDKIGSYLFDGAALYTCHRLPGATKDVPMELSSVRESDQKIIVISIRLVGDVGKSDIQYCHVYNIIMRKALNCLGLQLVGRNYFDANAKVVIPEFGFELWPGYLTTIKQHERGVLLGVEVTHKVMRHQTILNILDEIRMSRPPDLQAACKRAVIGLTVLTEYNNRTYRVDDIDFSKNPRSPFPGNGNFNTYVDYYQQKYGKRIGNQTQPLLLSRSRVRDLRAGQDDIICLIPELCRATGLTDSMKSDFRLMKAMADHTRVTPKVRIEKLLKFNNRLISEPKVIQQFKIWELDLSKQLVELPGRVLDPEKILFNRRIVMPGERADWQSAFRNTPMFVCASLQDWFCLVPNQLYQDTRSFITNMIRVGQTMGFTIREPRYVQMQGDSAQNYSQQLEVLMSQNNPQLVFCVSARQRADVYQAIKKKCCVDRPVPSQVLLGKHFRNPKGVMSIATKVAIQLNCKIGGAPWSCEIPMTGLMVVGFDVCHDPSQRGTDIGAVIASLDRGLGRYFSAVTRHSSNEELSNDFGVNMVRAVRKYHELNKAFPERIVIYRDGVGDGQIAYVQEHEVKTIRKALAEFYGSPEQVRLTFVLVTKRINTRFFGPENSNPPPGTVVDDVVTNPNRYDFFIVAQHVGQGSVSPTAYNVLDDTAACSVNMLQSLTFKLTHMYFNWSGTVRVPAPCQYAHKLAFLVSQSIHKKPSNHLETLLYFL